MVVMDTSLYITSHISTCFTLPVTSYNMTSLLTRHCAWRPYEVSSSYYDVILTCLNITSHILTCFTLPVTSYNMTSLLTRHCAWRPYEVSSSYYDVITICDMYLTTLLCTLVTTISRQQKSKKYTNTRHDTGEKNYSSSNK